LKKEEPQNYVGKQRGLKADPKRKRAGKGD